MCLLFRSVGGSYDNEGVAIFALIFCFYLWVKSVHTGLYCLSHITTSFSAILGVYHGSGSL